MREFEGNNIIPFPGAGQLGQTQVAPAAGDQIGIKEFAEAVDGPYFAYEDGEERFVSSDYEHRFKVYTVGDADCCLVGMVLVFDVLRYGDDEFEDLLRVATTEAVEHAGGWETIDVPHCSRRFATARTMHDGYSRISIVFGRSARWRHFAIVIGDGAPHPGFDLIIE